MEKWKGASSTPKDAEDVPAENVAEVLEKMAPEFLETAASENKGLEGEMVKEVLEKAASEMAEKAALPLVDKILETALTDAAKKVCSAAAAEAKISLKSNDGELLTMAVASARQSKELTRLIDDFGSSCFPFNHGRSSFDSKTLRKVIEYCDEHGNSKPDEEKEKLKEFDTAFIRELEEDKPCLYNVLTAANFLGIGGLFDLCCERVRDAIKGRTSDEIRAAFNITGNFTLDYREEDSGESCWVYNEEVEEGDEQSSKP